MMTLLAPTSPEKQQSSTQEPQCSPNPLKTSLISLGSYAYFDTHTMNLNTRRCARGMSRCMNFTIFAHFLAVQSRNLLLHQNLHLGKIYHCNPPTRIHIYYILIINSILKIH